MKLSKDDLVGLVDARRRRPHWHALPPDCRPQSEVAGYRLQNQIHDALASAGITRIGYKIGSTSKEGQLALGLSEPVYAGIFDITRSSSLREALSLPLLSPSVECEIAVVLGAQLRAGGDLSDDVLAGAVSSAHLACEIVDNRYGLPLDIGIPTILTDDFFHSSFVLGPATPDWRSLIWSDLAGATEINGTVVRGSTAQVLRPLQALRWLVEKLGLQGGYIGPGEVVLTGSLVKPTPVTLPARTVSIAVEGFGSLSLAD